MKTKQSAFSGQQLDDPTPCPSPSKVRVVFHDSEESDTLIPLGEKLGVPDVSVVIPVHHPKIEWLARAVESCLWQDVLVEIILVYDGAWLGCEWVPVHEQIKVVRIPHQGQAAAQNAGMEVARGEYRMVLADDDYFEQNVLGTLYRAASAMHYSYGDVNVPLGVHQTPYSPEPHARGEGLRTGYAVMWHSMAWETGLRYYKPIPGYPEDHDWVLQLERLGMRGVKVPLTVWNYRERQGGGAEMLRQNWDEAYRILWDRFDRGYEWE